MISTHVLYMYTSKGLRAFKIRQHITPKPIHVHKRDELRRAIKSGNFTWKFSFEVVCQFPGLLPRFWSKTLIDFNIRIRISLNVEAKKIEQKHYIKTEHKKRTSLHEEKRMQWFTTLFTWFLIYAWKKEPNRYIVELFQHSTNLSCLKCSLSIEEISRTWRIEKKRDREKENELKRPFSTHCFMYYTHSYIPT